MSLCHRLVSELLIHDKEKFKIRKKKFACLFSVHDRISLPRNEQVCLIRLNLLYKNSKYFCE